MTYSSLHNHTDYSNLKIIDSINTVEMLIDYAYELGLYGVAITDHDCLSGHIKAIKYYQEKYQQNAEKFHLILGNEIYLTRQDLNEDTHQTGEKFYHLLLLAKDEIGHQQLRELSSRAWSRQYIKGIMRTPTYLSDLREVVGSNPNHLICSTACLGSLIGTAFTMRYDNYEAIIQEFCATLASIFPNNFYIELQASHSQEQIAFNKYMIEHYGSTYPFIITTDSHYLKREERQLHSDFLKSASSMERETGDFYDATYMMSADEIISYMPYVEASFVQKCFDNSNQIADSCQFYSLHREQEVPSIEYSQLDTTDYMTVSSKIDIQAYPTVALYFGNQANEHQRYFAQLIAPKLLYAMEQHPSINYFERLEEELTTVETISAAKNIPLIKYFTTMNKIIDIIWKAGSFVGPGRGSAVGFLCNYLLGNTQLDPMVQHTYMPPWRFLDPGRPELPDIDIDTESNKRLKIFNAIRTYFRTLGGEVLNICTVGTLGTKAAIRTACKSLDIDDIIVNYLVSLVPTERGFDWTLQQCRYGDDEHKAIPAFDNEMKLHESVWKLALRIQGLITHLGVHASGVIIFNKGVVEMNSIMKTRSKTLVTCWDLSDSEYTGGLKYDLLTVQALDKIRICFHHLLNKNYIQWQGSLKATYNKYLSPEVINFTEPKMWQLLCSNSINEVFQYDTDQGIKALKLIRPQSIGDLASGNAVMRLMAEGEQPLDKFARFKHDIKLWYDEMRSYHLTEAEIAVLEKYLKPNYGVASTQETMMLLTMDPNISGFTVPEANKLRKGVAKKKKKIIDECQELFFSNGAKLGTSSNLLTYVWEKQVMPQAGYSFSILHTTAYSVIAVQEMNLAYYYPIILWNTACLTVSAGAYDKSTYEVEAEEDETDDADIDTLYMEDEKSYDEDGETTAGGKINYVKLAKAIERFKKSVNLILPDINRSQISFVPDVESNSILFGLKGINKIGDDLINAIIANRPYTDLNDFLAKMAEANCSVSRDKMINLIKAGCFDSLYPTVSRERILRGFIKSLAPAKSRITLQNISSLLNYDLLPSSLNFEKGLCIMYSQLKGKRDKYGYYPLNEEQIAWCNKWYKMPDVLEGQYKISADDFQIAYIRGCEKIRTYLKDHQAELIQAIAQKDFEQVWNKYAAKDQNQWELDAINFYYSGHPLANMNFLGYDTRTPLNQSDSIMVGYSDKKQQFPKYETQEICGVVISKNKVKRVVNISTPNEIISVKFYKSSYSKYDKVIKDNEGTIVDDSYFKKGTILLLQGYFKDNMFIPKKYNDERKNMLPAVSRIILDNNKTWEWEERK